MKPTKYMYNIHDKIVFSSLQHVLTIPYCAIFREFLQQAVKLVLAGWGWGWVWGVQTLPKILKF
jgi:hypothetical protein